MFTIDSTVKLLNQTKTLVGGHRLVSCWLRIVQIKICMYTYSHLRQSQWNYWLYKLYLNYANSHVLATGHAPSCICFVSTICLCLSTKVGIFYPASITAAPTMDVTRWWPTSLGELVFNWLTSLHKGRSHEIATFGCFTFIEFHSI